MPSLTTRWLGGDFGGGDFGGDTGAIGDAGMLDSWVLGISSAKRRFMAQARKERSRSSDASTSQLLQNPQRLRRNTYRIQHNMPFPMHNFALPKQCLCSHAQKKMLPSFALPKQCAAQTTLFYRRLKPHADASVTAHATQAPSNTHLSTPTGKSFFW